MKLRTTIHRVRLGRDEYRVVTAAPRDGRAVLYDGDWSLQLYADRPAAEDLAAAWALAARSPRSLVHLPLRDNTGPAGQQLHHDETRLDLVLLHHTLGFPPSRWKDVRARLRRGGVPHTADIPESDFPAEAEIDFDRHHFADWRDGLHFAGAARTLFLTGSAEAFRWTGSLVRSLGTEAPAWAAGAAGRSHFCVTLTHGPGGLFGRPPKGAPGQLHVEYAHGWTAA
ncbi:hypothetical protein RMN57_27585 [Kitasatospora sp. CM 4170]|uniref:Uncharacterized protein n=1 Tax=Kitasatospora aburaviensis TaxID=67265 RepID=A0ABW1EX43_9ACTN|nr:hypothetical protein [Kitasatospora sp. CM 4170]WNM48182.1 hypothetical protein RMN57_27585 [Kitasatospora sp. CM 4170]